MILSDYWGALNSRQRVSLSVGSVLIMLSLIAAGLWLLWDPYVSLASGLDAERLGTLTQELDRAKLAYRIGEGAADVEVPRSQLGRARIAVSAAGPLGVPPSVGLELFKETDFSSTDFAQRINYQRALQGELTRTIQTIAGVRSARVHVILPDGGLFKRNAAKASAAVSVLLQPGKVLTRVQVHGIQQLVAASVPEIKLDDVVVLDESGAGLTRAAGQADGELPSTQLELKRQVDQYLEGKLQRLLQELVPQGTASLSVDTVLDDRQLRVTTEEPIAAPGRKDAEHATGVLLKERQSQNGKPSGSLQAAGDTTGADSTDWEYEYKVGQRIEQALSAPGSIKRVSVAVALRGAPIELSSPAVEQLVAHAIGIDRARGDSVDVLLLPGLQTMDPSDSSSVRSSTSHEHPMKYGTAFSGPQDKQFSTMPTLGVFLFVALAAAFVVFVLWFQRQIRTRERPESPLSLAEVDAMAVRVRDWLKDGADRGRI